MVVDKDYKFRTIIFSQNIKVVMFTTSCVLESIFPSCKVMGELFYVNISLVHYD